MVDEGSLVSRVAEAVAGGVDMVQLREKDLPGGPLLELAVSLRDAIAGRALLIINDRADVAAAVGAAGVQLGEEGLPVDAARLVLGDGALIGCSVHSEAGASQAAAQGCGFLIVGAMYPRCNPPWRHPRRPQLGAPHWRALPIATHRHRRNNSQQRVSGPGRRCRRRGGHLQHPGFLTAW